MSEILNNEQYETMTKTIVSNPHIIKLFKKFFDDLGINENTGGDIVDRLVNKFNDYVECIIILHYDNLFKYAIYGNYSKYRNGYGYIRDSLFLSLIRLCDHLDCELVEFKNKFEKLLDELLDDIYKCLNHNYEIKNYDNGIIIIDSNNSYEIDKSILPGFIKDLLSVNFSYTKNDILFKFKYRYVDIVEKIKSGKDSSESYKTKTIHINKHFVFKVLEKVINLYSIDSYEGYNNDKLIKELDDTKNELKSCRQRLDLYRSNEKKLIDQLNDLLEQIKTYDPSFNLEPPSNSLVEVEDTDFEAM